MEFTRTGNHAPGTEDSPWASDDVRAGVLDSEEDLESQPVDIGRRREAVRGDGHWVAEIGVLPVEEDPGVEVEIPVQADVGSPDVVAPEVRVGESRGEDVPPDVHGAGA